MGNPFRGTSKFVVPMTVTGSASYHRKHTMPHARKDLIQWETGQHYHIYNRGARQLTIFPDQASYLEVLKMIKEYCRKYHFALLAYCLMPNHYHFLVRQDGVVQAGQLAQRVFNRYSKAYNLRHNKSGTLFESRFKAIHVDDDEYLHRLCYYIHANPVKDGIVGRIEEWPFSNYLDWVGERAGELLDRQFIDEHFGGAARYKQTMAEFIRGKRYLDKRFDDML